MKNGVPFALATVVIDRYLDIVVVGFIFLALCIIGSFSKTVIVSMLFYFALSLFLILAAGIAYIQNKRVKKLSKSIASVFNTRIEMNILVFFWGFISGFKDIFRSINKGALLVYTAGNWFFVLLSFRLFMYIEGGAGRYFETISRRLSVETLYHINIPNYLYSAASMGILLILSFLIPKGKLEAVEKPGNLLPHINEQDKRVFLEAYFEGNQRDFFRNYLELTRDVNVVSDLSAGSTATTLLCSNDQALFYRKYVIGADSDKLAEQIAWLEAYASILPLPVITKKDVNAHYCCYDMAYEPGSIGFFNYIHSEPVEKSRLILYSVLESLVRTIHTRHTGSSSPEEIDRYIAEKVVKNIDIVSGAKELKDILHYENIIINGTEYRNLPALRKYISAGFLKDVFKDDATSVIHGDMTIENIVCVYNDQKDGYYLIDPNTGNIHETPFIDYAKLLQSLHGNYEFFMKIKEVKVIDNTISFMHQQSYSYKMLLDYYTSYLNEHFTFNEVRSIYFHEMVHWLRLLPYKIRTLKRNAMIFYAAFIIVLNYVVSRYGENNG
ncbi:hypothetical protein AGMMS50293_27010 [Spirochaetia bacterium]|nr:hypothetical protein AGMMS50293_27010 [Spirochaetia bacterium]